VNEMISFKIQHNMFKFDSKKSKTVEEAIKSNSLDRNDPEKDHVRYIKITECNSNIFNEYIRITPTKFEEKIIPITWCKYCLEEGKIVRGEYGRLSELLCEKHYKIEEGKKHPCPYCGSINTEWAYTEPDFNDGWKCNDCKNFFGGNGMKFDNPSERNYYLSYHTSYEFKADDETIILKDGYTGERE